MEFLAAHAEALLMAAYCTAISAFTFWLGWVWNGARQWIKGYDQGYDACLQNHRSTSDFLADHLAMYGFPRAGG